MTNYQGASMRSFRYWLSISVIVVAQIVGASCSSVGAFGSRQDLKVVTSSNAAGVLLEESVPEPFQPSDEIKASLNKIVAFSQSEDEGTKPSFIVRDNLPYFPYKYLYNDDSFAFHPMRLGVFIKDQASDSQISNILSIASRAANEGLVWFYPALYKNSRMQGPYWRYSCISQGTILAGFTKRALNTDGDFSIARKVFKGMTLDYFEGGVNLENRALLEMPSYLGAPEIILNGWLDALIHVRDYAEASGDAEAKELLSRNLQFLAESLDHFDVPEEKISRYSDLCPYRIALRTANAGTPEYYVEYRPLHEGFRTMRYKLRELTQETLSIYDNQITGRNGSILKATISASALYDTVILSSVPFEVTLTTGTMDLVASTPSATGRVIKVQSILTDKGLHEAILDKNSEYLIRGYPTNFSKGNGVNFYHSYHVIALMPVAHSIPMPESTRNKILSFAKKWKQYIVEKKLPDLYSFNDLEGIFNLIVKNRAITESINYSALEEWAINY